MLAPLLADGGLVALRRFDVRNNRISQDGVRKFARALEANAARGVSAVLVRRDGRLDALAGAGAAAAIAAGSVLLKEIESCTSTRRAHESTDYRRNYRLFYINYPGEPADYENRHRLKSRFINYDRA